MANPNIPQGTLNRLRGSVNITSFPELNVTASYLTEEGIDIAFDGPLTTLINVMVGQVTSEEPYVPCTVTVNLNRAIGLGDAYKQQWELQTTLGDTTIRTDSSVLSPFQFSNMAIANVANIRSNGKDAGLRVSLKGYYQINALLWNF